MIPHARTMLMLSKVSGHVNAAIEAMVEVKVWLSQACTIHPTAPFADFSHAALDQSQCMVTIGAELRAADALFIEHQSKILQGEVVYSIADSHVVMDALQKLRRTHEIRAELLSGISTYCRMLSERIQEYNEKVVAMQPPVTE